jgi:hypothetical protein
MANNQLQIVLDLVDNASSEFKRINADAIREVRSFERESKDSFKRVNQSTVEARKELKNFSDGIRNLRNQLFGVGIVLAVAVKGLNDAAKYNAEAKKTSDAFNASLTGLSATLGQTFEPAIKGLTFLIDQFRVVIEAALGGFIKLFSFTFEFLAELPSAFKNIFDNIKNVFTGEEDPIGIVEGFQRSFQRAMEVANIATDQILQEFNKTRINIQTGNTLEAEKKSIEDLSKSAEKSAETMKKSEKSKQIARKETESLVIQGLSTVAEKSKAAALLIKAIKMKENIMETASGVSKALGSFPPPINFIWAGLVAAAGVAQGAAIAGVGFAKGTDSVPSMLTPGEMVVPRDFASAIRSGDLSLSGPGNSSFGEVNIYIQGGVRSDGRSVESLAETLGFEFARQVRVARG